jgi:8-oxo-dGTP pyrophosphatase MutT (NUDIX family)
MTYTIRHTVRVILINRHNQILLQLIDTPHVTTEKGEYRGPFYTLSGGQIEPRETPQQTAVRELYEETGLKAKFITLGPIIWHEELKLILFGTPTLLKQKYIVAYTKQINTTSINQENTEKEFTKGLEWLNLTQIQQSPIPIYPSNLAKLLSPILKKHYPKEPLNITSG